ncbi:hypothetical protein [Ancylobacter defluvii]|uniref:KTSC domain-containing protein n=1 Tax=Ancylobacter defluvii TaxID=1282440 RepID=A0A9W6JYS9_9HYPH|nr:hypothetical protein [Ancylobacter defluvii]MBS7589365.1 hypothetical protein [Ancylobacter defluvii]GLK84978.1 hypothetical protein GCM10017653_30480 [Ancylobacter defluvii]
MRTLFLSLPFLLMASSAFAQAMPNSLNMTCAATSALVSQRGAIVIGTGPNIFDRYVANQRYCNNQQTTTPAWLQTSDQAQCFVGYRCRDRLFHSR